MPFTTCLMSSLRNSLGSNAEGECQEIGGERYCCHNRCCLDKAHDPDAGDALPVGEELLVEGSRPALRSAQAFASPSGPCRLANCSAKLQTASPSRRWLSAYHQSFASDTDYQSVQLLWWYAPVAVFILGDDAVLLLRILCQDMVDPFPDGWIRIDDVGCLFPN